MWGVVKKAINSDLNVPLNHLLWINDLATYGQNGYVAKNEKMIEELIKSGLLEEHKIALEEFVKLFPVKAKHFFKNPNFIRNISSCSEIMRKLLKEQTFIDEVFKNIDNIKSVLSNPSNARFISHETILLKQIFNDSRLTDFLLLTDNVLFNLLTDNHKVYPRPNYTGYGYENSVTCLLQSEIMKNAIWDRKISVSYNDKSKYKQGAFLILTANDQYIEAIDINGKYYEHLKNYNNKYSFLSNHPYIITSFNFKHDREYDFAGNFNIYKLN